MVSDKRVKQIYCKTVLKQRLLCLLWFFVHLPNIIVGLFTIVFVLMLYSASKFFNLLSEFFVKILLSIPFWYNFIGWNIKLKPSKNKVERVRVNIALLRNKR